MSYQVGPFCYADLPAASGAACARFDPVTSVSGGTVKTVSCVAGQADGGLLLRISTTSDTGGFIGSVDAVQSIAYQPCVESEKVDAYLGVFAAVLTLVAVCWGAWKVVQWVNTGARNQE